MIQEENWYKPEPGEPYRPLIALPRKIKDLDPWYENCTDAFFTGLDPPRTLEIATAMASATAFSATTSNSKSTPLVPTPSPTQHAGAAKTVNTDRSTPAPSQMQLAPEMNKTMDSGSDNVPGESDQQQHISDQGQDGHSPKTDINHPDQQSSVEGKTGNLDHAEPTNNGLSNVDPENISPGQMSQIKSALAPTPKDQPTPGRNQEANQNQTNPLPGEQPTIATQTFSENSSKQQNNLPNEHPFSGDPLNRGDGESQTVHLHAAVGGLPTSIAGLTLNPFQNGASINNVVATASAVPMKISGTPVSIDSSHRIHIGETSYDLPSLITDPPTTLINGAVVVPLLNAVSIHGTTLIAGGSSLTISGAALFLDSSNNLVLHEPLATQPTPASQTTKVNGVAAQSYSDGVSIAGTALNTGPSPVTTAKTPPSLSSDAIAADSPTVASSWRATSGTTARTSSTGLAGLTMGGPWPGGPSTTISLPPPPTPNDTENSTSTGGHTTKGKGSRTKSVSTSNIAAGLMTSMLLSLHVWSL